MEFMEGKLFVRRERYLCPRMLKYFLSILQSSLLTENSVNISCRALQHAAPKKPLYSQIVMKLHIFSQLLLCT